VYPGQRGLNEDTVCTGVGTETCTTMRTVFTIYVLVIAAGIVASVLVAITET
jgi:hypothetical protein